MRKTILATSLAAATLRFFEPFVRTGRSGSPDTDYTLTGNLGLFSELPVPRHRADL